MKHIGEHFTEWNNGELSSYLIHITKDTSSLKKDEDGNYLGGCHSDEAANKVIGKWTSQSALDLGELKVADYRIRLLRVTSLFVESATCCRI